MDLKKRRKQMRTKTVVIKTAYRCGHVAKTYVHWSGSWGKQDAAIADYRANALELLCDKCRDAEFVRLHGEPIDDDFGGGDIDAHEAKGGKR